MTGLKPPPGSRSGPPRHPLGRQCLTLLLLAPLWLLLVAVHWVRQLPNRPGPGTKPSQPGHGPKAPPPGQPPAPIPRPPYTQPPPPMRPGK